MARTRVLICRFPGTGWEHTDVVDWLIKTTDWMARSPAHNESGAMKVVDTPVDMSRNRACEAALGTPDEQKANGGPLFDYLLFLDDDTVPDYDPGAPPFLPTALEFMRKQEKPCVVGAPYCSGGASEKVLVYRWYAETSGNHDGFDLREYPREEAAVKTGFEQVAALGTGCLLIDTRVLLEIPGPYFFYEWANPRTRTVKASTEDIVFTRDLGLAKVPLFVAWDSWCAHVKPRHVFKPTLPAADHYPRRLTAAVRHAVRQGKDGEPWGDETADPPPRFMFPAGLPAGVSPGVVDPRVVAQYVKKLFPTKAEG